MTVTPEFIDQVASAVTAEVQRQAVEHGQKAAGAAIGIKFLADELKAQIAAALAAEAAPAAPATEGTQGEASAPSTAPTA